MREWRGNGGGAAPELGHDGILVIDDFLSKRECQRILEELEIAHWHPSLTYRKQVDERYRNELTPFRISETAHQEWFSDELQELLARVDRRLEHSFGVRASHLESWQATHYARNGKFDYHLDAGYWDDHPAGDRILTFLLHLTTPKSGGDTHFRALDVCVESRARRLVAWSNLWPNGDCNYRMIHSGTPLHRGKKTTLVTWQRQRAYRVTP